MLRVAMTKNRIYTDVLVSLAVVVVGTIGLVAMDAFELFYEFSRTHEEYNLDEIAMAMPLLVTVLFVFALIRTNDIFKENIKRRKAEAIANDMRQMKEEFMAAMSHDMRTPLNGIMMIFELLQDEELEPSARELVKVAQGSGRSMQAMINDILEFTRLGHNDIAGSHAVFSPETVFESVHKALVPTAMDKGIEFPAPETASLPKYVYGIEGALRQIISNLADNAVKFTQEGSVVIVASFQQEKENSGRLFVEVRDTGPGIDQEDVERIFEPFTQLDSRLNRKHGGIGLGLSMVKRLVTLWKGEIRVDSEPGHGTAFHVSLPIIIQMAGQDPLQIR